MLLVKNVDIEILPDDKKQVEIQKFEDISFNELNNSQKIRFTKELVTGEIFTNVDGTKIIIAWTEDVQKTLGLPFKVFKDQRNCLMNYHTKIIKLKTKIEELEKMSIWEFIKKKLKW